MKRTFPALSLATVAAAAGALLAACSEPTAPIAVVRPVFVTTVTQATSSQTRSFTAVVRARVETDLGFRAGGKVVERLVEVGDVVKAGQALARLDPLDYQLAERAAADQVQAASVDAQQAASDEARLSRLLADGSVGAADHERQKARADAAAARLELARRQLDLARNREGYTSLVAPYAGVITALRFERGQVVAEGQPVLSIAREGEREIVADLPEEWVGRVRGLTAWAAPWNETTSALRLVLRGLSPVANAQARTFRVRYAAAPESRAAAAALPLGSTLQLNLSGKPVGPASAMLPVTALVKASGSAGVWVLNAKGSGLVFNPVQVVRVDDATVHVSGLALGSRVVSVGAQKLDAGTAVRAIERTPEAAPAAMTKSSS
ncbi:efflux RND transporter periplasmic adaptor subunit [Paucibacter sp. PLA-PC-4]|uniref:efflux RND transporter periplasmic adaptor subunit n=1 Tax=Paucibacter sp. PLA-PC-4 TaxID=2993655 RepID=UPI00224AFCBE|nr:efflux RND transporter periplasmic adaptor subunit [Paucibacter sp. PLA-PC-4]MCX2864703.1 efflux RND transporter periplasmic adaptor subunit [Paucibacter sp. PLA-PC-4]